MRVRTQGNNTCFSGLVAEAKDLMKWSTAAYTLPRLPLATQALLNSTVVFL
jgi:hypothetical protein